MVVVRGIDNACAQANNRGERHPSGMCTLLTGTALQQQYMIDPRLNASKPVSTGGDGIALDQKVARLIAGNTPLRTLEVGVRTNVRGDSTIFKRLSYTGPGAANVPEDDPAKVFARLFMGGAPPDPAPSPTPVAPGPTPLQKLQADRLSILDGVKDQFAQARMMVGAEDRQRLEQHLTMLRELELQLGAMAGSPAPAGGSGGPVTGPPRQANGQCNRPSLPAYAGFDAPAESPKVAAAQLELVATALACDLTRVATFTMFNAGNFTFVNAWYPSMIKDRHHYSHGGNTASRPENIGFETWNAEQLAKLLARLDSIKEGNGTVLDNTLVLWCSEVAVGDHSYYGMPFTLIGGAGGALKTGRYLQTKATPHNDLLTSLHQLFGSPEPKFGDPQYCTGPLAGLV
jgi:hypothetical protein